MRSSAVVRAGVFALVAAGAGGAVFIQNTPPGPTSTTAGWSSFDPHEASIDDVIGTVRAGRADVSELLALYLARVDAYDRDGPSLNAIVALSPTAASEAARLDALPVSTRGPLHGITVVVGDNIDVAGMPTTAGTAALRSSVPNRDASVVARLRAAGAIVLGKTNLSDLGLDETQTLGSLHPGYTFDPYSLNRAIAGANGGAVAAVAASFATAGLASDGESGLRGPAASAGVVALRPTVGLVSQAGALTNPSGRDVIGPVGRTVSDVARVLDVVAGSDPEDALTAGADSQRRGSYLSAVGAGGLAGKRIGVLRQLSDRPMADAGVASRFETALDDLGSGGAIIVDSIRLTVLEPLRTRPLGCRGFAADAAAYFARLGPAAPIRSLAQILELRTFHPDAFPALSAEVRADGSDGPPPGCDAEKRRHEEIRGELERVMAELRLDALVYPLWANPQRILGDLEGPDGNNGRFLAPEAGFPAMTVPMGRTAEGLPTGLGLLGLPWSEPTLLAIASGYEARTRHHRASGATPPLYLTY